MARTHANGITLEYESFGPEGGMPLLLIHGYGQQCIAWPGEFIDGFVGAGMRVITYDNRDTGLSEKWDGKIPDMRAVMSALKSGNNPFIPYTLSDMAGDAAGLLEALRIGSAHVAGASMGGMIAQLVALEHRKKVRSLTTIFSTTGDYGLPPSSAEAHLALVAQAPTSDRETVIAHVLKSRRAYASSAFPSDEKRLAEIVGRIYDRSHYPEGTSRHWSAIVAAPPRGERLKSLDLPTLVLHGSADTLLPSAHGRRIAECVPGATYHEIEGWGHDIPPGVIPLLHDLMIPFIQKAERGRLGHNP
ncbi:MAG: alpha/beta hydrolase [Alphaproteobacteria bacterium]|nr:alpha/beta hydrolase [Alphaproteobacteria bacterium]